MLAVKPFKGQVIASVPSLFEEDPNAAKPPRGSLKLQYAFGYRCFDAKQMARYDSSGKVVFTAAAVGVQMDVETREQTFFDMHEEDIISLAIHPNGKIAATG